MAARDGVRRLSALVVETPDGARLVADAWLPAPSGPHPVLLQRLPYGRSVASSPVLPSPVQLARRGYAVVVQDVRGRGDSTGVFAPFATEAEDGAASVEWAAGLPFSDGRVVTYGFSYQGSNQLAAAARRPRGLVAVAALMCAGDAAGMVYEGGCLLWGSTAPWAAQLASQERGSPLRRGAPEALPTASAIGVEPPGWYLDWVSHREGDDFWQGLAPELSKIEVPVFTVLGYADTFAFANDALARAVGAAIVCGPWAHMPWGTRLGDLDLDDASPAVAIEAFLDFLERVLGSSAGKRAEGGGDPAGPQRSDLPARIDLPQRAGFAQQAGAPQPARFYVIGEGWRSAPAWPPAAEPLGLVATSELGANSRYGDGALVEVEGELPLCDVIVSEPLVPHPGELGPYPDRAAAEERRDVLCYTTPPLNAPLVVAGSPLVSVEARGDCPSFDLFAGLVAVGRAAARLVSVGAIRLEARAPGEERRAEIRLRPVAWRFEAGTCLRLELSATRFPLYDRNPQSPVPLPPGGAAREDHAVATIEVAAARLELPVLGDQPVEGPR
jgi:predicted acyl esterase